MGDDGDDGFAPEIKLKSSNDVLDQVDKDTEEVLDFNFVSGSSANNATVLAAKDPNDTVVDGIKGDEAPNDTNGSQEWGKKKFSLFFMDSLLPEKTKTKISLFLFLEKKMIHTHNFLKYIFHTTCLDIEPVELERLKRLYKGDTKKRHSLKEGSFEHGVNGSTWMHNGL